MVAAAQQVCNAAGRASAGDGGAAQVAQTATQGANQKAKSKQRGKTAAEPTALYNAPKSAKEFQQQIKKLEQQMYKFAQDLEFEKAAAVRDQLHQLREQFMISE